MEKQETIKPSRFWRIVTKPFRMLWGALSQISNLSAAQVKSLVTVAFLAGMISLSIENWGITFAADHAAHEITKDAEAEPLFLNFLTERMRYISGLQGWMALILGAVILNADRVELELGKLKASLGSNKDGGDE